jgi:N-acetylglutamate synthase-like GNAT family acetyltransferase
MTSDVTLRTALVSEQKALEALQLRASLNNTGDREALLAHPDAIELPVEQLASGQVFVAEDEGAIRGFAAILPRDDGDAELDALFVEPGLWRRGYGRKLIERCGHAARALGSHAIYVIANPHAEGFYVACGFEMYGTTQTQFGIGWLMRKPL